MTDNDFNELEELAKSWTEHNVYLPCIEACAREEAINNCGGELLKLLAVLKEKRVKNLNAIAKLASSIGMADIARKSGVTP